MVLAICSFGGTCCTDWICGLEMAGGRPATGAGGAYTRWCRSCVLCSSLQVRIWQRSGRDGRAAGLRRELCFTQLQERVS